MAQGDVITVDVKGWAKQVNRLAKDHGLEARDLVYDQQRLWSIDLEDKTPPVEKGFAKVSASRQKKIGMQAVDREINKLFYPMDTQRALDFFAEEFGTKGKRIGKKARTQIGNAFTNVSFNWTGDENKMRMHHERNRNTQGRVTHREKLVARRGGFAFLDSQYVPRGKLNRYIKKRQKKVGSLKSEWVASIDGFARLSKSRVTSRQVPSWVRRHGANGTFQANMKENGDGSAVSIHFSKRSNKALKAALTITARTRQRDLEKNLEKRIKEVAKRFEQRGN